MTASPDRLAAHPAITARAPDYSQDQPLFCEEVSYAAAQAFERLIGSEDDFYDTLHHHAGEEPAGEGFDFDDDQQMRRRLPDLAALYLTSSPA